MAENSELLAVMRRNAALAKDYAQRHKVKYWYNDAQELLDNKEVDAVYIATPPAFHYQYAMMAARAGKPTYIEKPFGLSHQQAKEINNTFKKTGIPLFVAYYRRALPRFAKIKSLIDQGAIGKVRFVNVILSKKSDKKDNEGQANWRVDPAISGGGYFVDLGSHTLDILQYFLGNIISADGNASNQAGLYPAEDMVSGNFIFATGVHGTGIWNFAAFDDLDRCKIVGEEGKIVFATFGNSPVALHTKDGLQSLDLPNPVHIQEPLIQTIVDELNGKGHCPSNGATALRTNWAMDKLRG
jgi:predicted dehydrogenase